MKDYNADSIVIKNFREAVRSTPAMYLGSEGEDGIFNGFMEILNNACDEAIMGRGNEIIVTLEDNKVTVEDFGYGIPRGPKGEIKEILVDLHTTAHSSGKFNQDNYKKVRGIHGIGASAICLTSKEYQIWTRREGKEWYLKFIEGVPQSDVAKPTKNTKKTGTTISFEPNKDIFKVDKSAPAFDKGRVEKELKLTSFFIPKVKFTLIHKGEKKTFYSENGLKDFAKEQIKKPLHGNYIYGYKQFDDEVEVEVFAQWTAGKEKSYVFSNGALNVDGGTPVTGAKSAFTRTVNTLANKSFDGDAIRKGLVYIINVRHPHPVYQNQIKSKIQNPELRGYTQTVFGEALKDFAHHNKNDFEKVVELLEKDQKADAAAERARKQVLEATKDIEQTRKKKVFNSDKLKDAEKLGPDATLLLVEGNSAAGSLAMARDTSKYGILSLRGKPINPLSHSEEKVLQNEEIKLILSAIGASPGRYNPSSLRYGKVAIASDADSDGGHVGLLIMAIFRALVPGFIEDGRLHWLRSPLYIRTKGKEEYYYFSDEEFAASKIKGGTIKRNKGLGSLQVEEAERSMFDPKHQRMEKLVPDEAALELLDNLMGKDIEPRREFVFNRVDFSEVRE